MVESHLGSLLERLAENHPVDRLVLHSRYIRPAALNQQHVTFLDLHSTQISQNVIILATHSEDIDAELAAEARLGNFAPYHGRSRHYQDLRHTYIEEIHRRMGRRPFNLVCMYIEKSQRVV